MTRWSVTITWEDYPEGGTYGSVVEADSREAAISLCKREMALSRNPRDEQNPEEIIAEYGDDWDVIECYDLDQDIIGHIQNYWWVVVLLDAGDIYFQQTKAPSAKEAARMAIANHAKEHECDELTADNVQFIFPGWIGFDVREQTEL